MLSWKSPWSPNFGARSCGKSATKLVLMSRKWRTSAGLAAGDAALATDARPSIAPAAPKTYFIRSSSEAASCPADTAACRARAYLVQGDLVLAGATHGAFTCATKQTWLATARGRVGYAFDRWLPYLTGGAAFSNIKASSTNPAAPGASPPA